MSDNGPLLPPSDPPVVLPVAVKKSLWVRWREQAPIVGTGAQWVSAMAAVVTMGVAIYGVSAAVPYFQNRLLSEEKAELELSVRALRKEKSDADAALLEQRERLAKVESSHREQMFAATCREVEKAMGRDASGFMFAGRRVIGRAGVWELFQVAHSSLSLSEFLSAEDKAKVRQAWMKLNSAEKELEEKGLLAEILGEAQESWEKERSNHGGKVEMRLAVSEQDFERVTVFRKKARIEIVRACLSAQDSK
jgi:hypothetical protein